MSRLFTWLDDRTGYKGLVHGALNEHIPGGARYVWGSTLTFAFVVQMITGLFLWMHYSPSSQTAWESVYYIQNEMSGGWLLRGIHHYAAQTMIILLAFHMLQVIVDGAYRAPREINFWFGLILLNLTLALALTGYLLPWDQKGYWSTKVATNLMGVVPVVGAPLQRLVVGGPDYGHHTLTRFFALHAGLLPLLMIGMIALHVAVFRRHGLTHKEPKRGPDSTFWPDQVLRDAVACLGVLLFILVLTLRFKILPGGSEHLGAELTAPADPAEPFGAARPEWYFLFLFQFLKLPVFSGNNEVYGAVVIPGAIMAILFLMPLVGRFRVGHWFNVAFTVFLSVGMVLLTAMAIVEDAGGPRVGLPVLGNLGPTVNIVLLGVMLLGTLVLVPLFTRERSFRFNMITMGVLLLLVLVGVGMVLAGGGAAVQGPVTAAFGYVWDVQKVLLLALLGVLVLLFTVVLFRDYPHAGEVKLDGTAADAAAARDGTLGAAERMPESDAFDGGERAAVEGERAALLRPDDLEPADDDGAAAREPISLRRWQLHHRLRLGMLMTVVVGVVFLTAISIVGGEGKEDFRLAVEQARHDAERIVVLAQAPAGIPPGGAVFLLREDPKTQGPKLFSANCASCHRYGGHDGTGFVDKENPQSAPDLKDFATRDWIAGMLDPKQVDTLKYFGPHMEAHTGNMVEYVKEGLANFVAQEGNEQEEMVRKVAIALSAEANLPAQRAADARDAKIIEEGRALHSHEDIGCTGCHTFREEKASKKNIPDLTGYGSEEWTLEFIRNAAHPRFYGRKNDRMPLYGKDKLLDDKSILLITKWLRGDWYEPGAKGDVARQSTPATQPATAPTTQTAAGE